MMMIEQWSRLLGGMKFTMDLNNIKNGNDYSCSFFAISSEL